MQDEDRDQPLAEAVERAAEFGAPARVWHPGPDAVVDFGDATRHPFDGLTITHWAD